MYEILVTRRVGRWHRGNTVKLGSMTSFWNDQLLAGNAVLLNGPEILRGGEAPASVEQTVTEPAPVEEHDGAPVELDAPEEAADVEDEASEDGKRGLFGGRRD